MNNIFSPPDTKCNGCIFEAGLDCRLNKIELYKQHNIKVEVKDKHNLIKDFICPYYRNQEWHANCNTNVVEAIQKENKLQYITILLHMQPIAIMQTVRRIKDFDIPPKEIFIILKQEDKNITADMKEICPDIKWHVYFELEEDAWHNIFKFYNRREFMVLINSFPYVHYKWASKITEKIQDELLKFSYAENNHRNMTLIAPYVYNMYYFSFGKDWLQQLKRERWQQKYTL